VFFSFAATDNAVFLNLPYDSDFEKLFIAYIVGLHCLGLRPRVTLGLPGGKTRKDKIIELIEECAFSIHDLSRVELDRSAPATPRFNMPFELGLAVAIERYHPKKPMWFVFETVQRRADKSLSDMKGSDHYIHDGTVEGVMRELSNAFTRTKANPTVPRMMEIFRTVADKLPELKRIRGARDCFSASMFEDLCLAAQFEVDHT